MSSGSKGRRPRKGSLAWYHNSKRGIAAPSVRTRDQTYFEKVGMDRIMRVITTHLTNKTTGQSTIQRLTPVTILRALPFTRVAEGLIQLKLPNGKSCLRVSDGKILDPDCVGKRLTVISHNKAKGILGPNARRGVKLGKRKAIGSGTVRHAGCMGCREPGMTSWRKPFMGRTGGNRRTIRGNEVVRIIERDSETYCLIKGTVPGPKGQVLCLR